ncbi:MAG TPA: ester cyclase [Candidatus Cybelea sp.]|jgi:predicted ester cyclase|nr:ester cyclase [Candidatus Cybelea sp.]
MPVRENIEFVHRAIARFNAKDLEGYLEMFDKAVVFHGLSRRLKPGVGGLREYYAALRLAFPDMRLASEDVIAEGEKVANRYTFYGTHKGDYMGIAPTSKLIISAGMVIHHFRGGRCVETWQSTDALGFLTQLGVAQPLPVK